MLATTAFLITGCVVSRKSLQVPELLFPDCWVMHVTVLQSRHNLCCAGGFKHGNKESVIPIRIGPAKHYERSAVTIYVFIHFKCMAMKSWLMGL